MNGEHEDIREQFSAYLDGEMGAEARAAFEARVAADPALRAELDAGRRVDALYRELEPVRAPEALEAAVLDEMRGTRIRFRRPRAAPVRLWPVLAAAACFVVVAGLMFSRFTYMPSQMQLAREKAAPQSPVREVATEAAADAAVAQTISSAQPEAKMETSAGAQDFHEGVGETPAPQSATQRETPETTYFVTLDTVAEEAAPPPALAAPAPSPPPAAEVAAEVGVSPPPPAQPTVPPERSALDAMAEKKEADGMLYSAAGLGSPARELNGLEPAPAPAPAETPVAAMSAPAPMEQEAPLPALAEPPAAPAETIMAAPEPPSTPRSAPSFGEDRLEKPRRAYPVGGYGGGYGAAGGGYGGAMRRERAAEAGPPKMAPPAPAATAPEPSQAAEAVSTREVEGRRFILRGDTWQQEDYADASLTEVRRDSRFYRVLLKNHPEIEAIAALGPRVILNVSGHWYLLLPSAAE